jgi:hypothetical protein
MLKKNKRQKMGQAWLIVVRLPEQMFNCIQLLIVLPSAQKQNGRERSRLGVCWGIRIPSAHNQSTMIAILLIFYS